MAQQPPPPQAVVPILSPSGRQSPPKGRQVAGGEPQAGKAGKGGKGSHVCVQARQGNVSSSPVRPVPPVTLSIVHVAAFSYCHIQQAKLFSHIIFHFTMPAFLPPCHANVAKAVIAV